MSCHQAAFRPITSHGSGSVRLPSAVDRSCYVRRGTSCSLYQAAMTTSPSLPYIITNRLPRNHHVFCAPSAAIMTSLTPQEARVVHKLNLFASVCPQCLFVKDSHELIRQLYRFNYFYPSKKKRVKLPKDWDWYYAEPNGSLQTTARKVQEWFTRPDALKAPEPAILCPSDRDPRVNL